MTQTLIVSGCSIAHGCGTYTGFMHEKNVENSFSQHLANKLKCNLKNVALSGCSNDYIFFSTMQEIEKNKNIHSIIVSWTSINRLTWIHKNRHWMFVPRWAASVEKKNDSEFADFKRSIEDHQVWYSTDRVEDIEILKTQHDFFLKNYVDTDMGITKLKIYSQSLQAVCKQNNVKLIEITPFNNLCTDHIYQYNQTQSVAMFQGRHPNKQEHILIAEELFDKYYRAN